MVIGINLHRCTNRKCKHNEDSEKTERDTWTILLLREKEILILIQVIRMDTIHTTKETGDIWVSKKLNECLGENKTETTMNTGVKAFTLKCTEDMENIPIMRGTEVQWNHTEKEIIVANMTACRGHLHGINEDMYSMMVMKKWNIEENPTREILHTLMQVVKE